MDSLASSVQDRHSVFAYHFHGSTPGAGASVWYTMELKTEPVVCTKNWDQTGARRCFVFATAKDALHAIALHARRKAEEAMGVEPTPEPEMPCNVDVGAIDKLYGIHELGDDVLSIFFTSMDHASRFVRRYNGMELIVKCTSCRRMPAHSTIKDIRAFVARSAEEYAEIIKINSLPPTQRGFALEAMERKKRKSDEEARTSDTTDAKAETSDETDEKAKRMRTEPSVKKEPIEP